MLAALPSPAQRSTAPPRAGKACRPRLQLVPAGATPLREQPEVKPIFGGPVPVRIAFLDYGPNTPALTWFRQNAERHGQIHFGRLWWEQASPAERYRVAIHELVHVLGRRGYFLWGREDELAKAAVARLEQTVNALADHLQQVPHLGALLVTLGVLSRVDGTWLDALAAARADVEDLHA